MSEKVTLKQRFFIAIVAGKLGKHDDDGVIVMQNEFKAYFKKQIKTQYINSFLPAATIEKGRTNASHTRFVTRIRKGSYRVHPDALDAAIEEIIEESMKKSLSN